MEEESSERFPASFATAADLLVDQLMAFVFVS